MFTKGDTFSNFFTGFAIEVVAPELEVIKKAFRADGSELSNTDEVNLGDDVTYEITITNNGNDNAFDVSFVDVLPVNTIFDASNILLNGVLIPETSITIIDTTVIDESAMLTFDTKQLSIDIDDNLLETDESVVISFDVTLEINCDLLKTCTNQVQNQADVSYSGGIISDSNSLTTYIVQSAFELDTCNVPNAEPTTFLIDTSKCFSESSFMTAALCSETVKLEAGYGFAEYQWFFEGNRLTQNADGTNISSTDNTIIVDLSGTYTVEQIKSTSTDALSCLNVSAHYDVILFDPSEFSIEYTIQEQATCTIDNDVTDNFDPTVATILATTTAGSSSYIFNLVDTITNTIIQSSGTTTENTYLFANLNPNNSYEIELTTEGGCSHLIPVTGLNIPTEDCISIDEVIENNCSGIQVWNANDIYSEVGTQVVLNNKIYENKWYTKNQNPEDYSVFSWSLWTLIGECDNMDSETIALSSLPINNTNEIIENSCGIQVWNANDIYSEVGTQVVLNNKIYENKWYTKNQNPEDYSAFSWSLWTLIGECESTNIDSEVIVYPNTFISMINVTIEDTDQTVNSLQLIDLSGNIIANEQGTSISNLDAIANGVYLLQILNTNNQVIATERVIKQ